MLSVVLDPDPNPNRPSTMANMQKGDFFMAVSFQSNVRGTRKVRERLFFLYYCSIC